MSSKYTFGSVDKILGKRKAQITDIPSGYQPPLKKMKICEEHLPPKEGTGSDKYWDDNATDCFDLKGTEFDPIWIDSDDYSDELEYTQKQEERLEEEFLKEVDLDTSIYMKYLFPRMMGWTNNWKPLMIPIGTVIALMEN